MSSGFAIHDLAIEQSARPGGPNTMADLCAIKTNIQNSLDNFEARFRGQRENQSFILCSANTRAAFLRECARVLL